MASTRVRNGLAVAAIGVALFATLGEASKTETSTSNQAPAAAATSGTSKAASPDTAKVGSSTTAVSVTTTLAAPAAPAAPDASPYVEGFGDLSVVKLPAGDPDAVTIIASTPTLDSSSSVSIIVRNNTRKAVGEITVTGTARDEAGKLVGSGDTQLGMQPRVVAPGEIAFGYVYFKTDSPAGSPLKFTFEVKSEAPGTYFVPLTVSEINNTSTKIIGAVKNGTGGLVKGPISANAICFAYDGSILDNKDGHAEQEDLPDGGTGTFSIDLYSDPCPIGLVTGSGYGKL